eukprot:scaffold429_cov269-Pinguiococcus_pyrenoidosus.AAC.12
MVLHQVFRRYIICKASESRVAAQQRSSAREEGVGRFPSLLIRKGGLFLSPEAELGPLVLAKHFRGGEVGRTPRDDQILLHAAHDSAHLLKLWPAHDTPLRRGSIALFFALPLPSVFACARPLSAPCAAVDGGALVLPQSLHFKNGVVPGAQHGIGRQPRRLLAFQSRTHAGFRSHLLPSPIAARLGLNLRKHEVHAEARACANHVAKPQPEVAVARVSREEASLFPGEVLQNLLRQHARGACAQRRHESPGNRLCEEEEHFFRREHDLAWIHKGEAAAVLLLAAGCFEHGADAIPFQARHGLRTGAQDSTEGSKGASGSIMRDAWSRRGNDEGK